MSERKKIACFKASPSRAAVRYCRSGPGRSKDIILEKCAPVLGLLTLRLQAEFWRRPRLSISILTKKQNIKPHLLSYYSGNWLLMPEPSTIGIFSYSPMVNYCLSPPLLPPNLSSLPQLHRLSGVCDKYTLISAQGSIYRIYASPKSRLQLIIASPSCSEQKGGHHLTCGIHILGNRNGESINKVKYLDRCNTLRNNPKALGYEVVRGTLRVRFSAYYYLYRPLTLPESSKIITKSSHIGYEASMFRLARCIIQRLSTENRGNRGTSDDNEAT